MDEIKTLRAQVISLTKRAQDAEDLAKMRLNDQLAMTNKVLELEKWCRYIEYNREEGVELADTTIKALSIELFNALSVMEIAAGDDKVAALAVVVVSRQKAKQMEDLIAHWPIFPKGQKRTTTTKENDERTSH